MPLFDYACDGCGETFEVYVRHADIERLICCPHCRGVVVKKIPSLSNFVLRGSGWEKDGYQKKGEGLNGQNG